MYKMEELKKNINLLNSVEWDLDPAVAVGRHLEWGAGWACDNYTARGSGDQSIYFAISTWEKPTRVVLIKRTGFEMEELAEYTLPPQIEAKFLDSVGHKNGMYVLDGNVKNWLKTSLDVN